MFKASFHWIGSFDASNLLNNRGSTMLHFCLTQAARKKRNIFCTQNKQSIIIWSENSEQEKTGMHLGRTWLSWSRVHGIRSRNMPKGLLLVRRQENRSAGLSLWISIPRVYGIEYLFRFCLIVVAILASSSCSFSRKYVDWIVKNLIESWPYTR